MNKLIKAILIILITIFSVNLLLTKSVQAHVDELVVEFEQNPLFNEANFLPGESITRWVKVTNNSGQPQRIAVEAINVSDLEELGQVLNLEIKEGSETRYDDTLANFFNAGEIYLSDLPTGNTARYDFSVGFVPEAEAPQGATLGFDLLVGFQGVEGGVTPGTPPSGGGGGAPHGLTISNSKSFHISTTTATIIWLTSYPSTSQVVYGTNSGVFDLTKPNYGYPNAAPVPEDSEKVVAHSVAITGLTPDTTYYFRCVSHASPPTISQEHSFTTLAVGTEGGDGEIGRQAEQAGLAGETAPAEQAGPAEQAFSHLVGPAAGSAEGEEEKGLIEEEPVPEEEAGQEEVTQAEEKKEPGAFLAAIAGLTSSLGGWLIIIGVILSLLFILILIRKRRRRN